MLAAALVGILALLQKLTLKRMGMA
jgi:hypothetical protein